MTVMHSPLGHQTGETFASITVAKANLGVFGRSTGRVATTPVYFGFVVKCSLAFRPLRTKSPTQRSTSPHTATGF